MSTPVHQTLQANLNRIRQQIQRSSAVSGRAADDVRLIAVTKYAEWEWVQALSDLHPIFGESRPQQLAEREPQLPTAEWHLIGHLQRNKARTAVSHSSVIHSVDSTRLLERLRRDCHEVQRRISVLLQVNISGESSKSGFDPQTLRQQWDNITSLSQAGLSVTGLMTMAPYGEDPEATRPIFAGLRELRDRLNAMDSGLQLTELSMGMSRDFEVAIEEGATLVRVGSAVFDGLQPGEV